MQSHLQNLPTTAANLRRNDDDKRRQTTTNDERRRETTRRRKPCKHSSNPQTPNHKREPFATHSGKNGPATPCIAKLQIFPFRFAPFVKLFDFLAILLLDEGQALIFQQFCVYRARPGWRKKMFPVIKKSFWWRITILFDDDQFPSRQPQDMRVLHLLHFRSPCLAIFVVSDSAQDVYWLPSTQDA